MITNPTTTIFDPLEWTPSSSEGSGTLQSRRGGVTYQIAEGFGDFVLWIGGKNDKTGLVSISQDQDKLKREANLFANFLAPYAEERSGLDLASLVVNKSSHMATLWTLLVSPDFSKSEVEYGDQPKAE